MTLLSSQDNENIERVVRLLGSSRSILFVTGAGLSADSGLPTYRGIGGLYDRDLTDEGLQIETALAGSTMASRPEITWKYISHIEQACRDAQFNRGHEVVAEIERHFDRVWVLTQNIDGFHRAAGSKHVIDIHGDSHDLRCTQCSYRQTVEDYRGLQIPPRCPLCGAIVRPEVVLFGEMLPAAKCQLLAEELDKGFDIVFSIGTTSVFPYIAQPVVEAKRLGRPTVEINPGQTQVSHLTDVKISCGAAEALDAIWTRYQQQQAGGPTAD